MKRSHPSTLLKKHTLTMAGKMYMGRNRSFLFSVGTTSSNNLKYVNNFLNYNIIRYIYLF